MRFILSVRLARFNVLFCSQNRISHLRDILATKPYTAYPKIATIEVHPSSLGHDVTIGSDPATSHTITMRIALNTNDIETPQGEL
jgi:hypothetical protein